MQSLGAAGAIGFTAGCSQPDETETEPPGGTPEGDDTPTATPTPEPLQHGGTFIDGTISDSRAVNPLRLGDGSTSDRAAQLFDAGWARNSPQYDDIEPYWFESVDVADSLDVVELTLRDNLEYGNPYGQLKAEDYLWNIENIFKSDWYNYTYSYTFSVGKDDEPIQFSKPDDLTIRMELPEPRPFFPYNNPLGYVIPVPREIVEPYMEEEDAEGLDQDDQIRLATFSGNLGPWKLTNYKPQSVVSYERNEDWYMRDVAEDDDRVRDILAEAPFFDSYQIQYFSEESTGRQALAAGEIDRFNIPATKLSNFQNDDDLTIYTNPYIAYSDYLGMNQRANGWTQMRNKKVRQAFSNLYDNDFVVENILNGKGTTQDTLHPQWGPYYPDEDTLFQDEGSLDRAKTLLEEGTSSDWGYSGDEFVGPDGEQLELDLVYVSSTDDDLRVEYTKQRFNEAGIALNLNSTSWASLITQYFYTRQPAEGVGEDEPIGYGPEGSEHPAVYNWGPRDKAVSAKSWDLMHTLGFSYGPLDPSGTVAALFAEKETFNAYGHVPENSLVELRDKAKTAESIEAATTTVSEMMGQISESRPVAFESNYFSYNGYRDRVRGLPENPAPSYFVDQEKDIMAFEDGSSGR
jgi:peptide/nickel transport system substrate-binding protein